MFHRLGNQPVTGACLIERAGHQRVMNEPQTTGRIALNGKLVEIVERTDGGNAQAAALGRAFIDVREMGKAAW